MSEEALFACFKAGLLLGGIWFIGKQMQDRAARRFREDYRRRYGQEPSPSTVADAIDPTNHIGGV